MGAAYDAENSRVFRRVPLCREAHLGLRIFDFFCPTDGSDGVLGDKMLFSPAPPVKLVKLVAG